MALYEVGAWCLLIWLSAWWIYIKFSIQFLQIKFDTFSGHVRYVQKYEER